MHYNETLVFDSENFNFAKELRLFHIKPLSDGIVQFTQPAFLEETINPDDKVHEIVSLKSGIFQGELNYKTYRLELSMDAIRDIEIQYGSETLKQWLSKWLAYIRKYRVLEDIKNAVNDPVLDSAYKIPSTGDLGDDIMKAYAYLCSLWAGDMYKMKNCVVYLPAELADNPVTFEHAKIFSVIPIKGLEKPIVSFQDEEVPGFVYLSKQASPKYTIDPQTGASYVLVAVGDKCIPNPANLIRQNMMVLDI